MVQDKRIDSDRLSERVEDMLRVQDSIDVREIVISLQRIYPSLTVEEITIFIRKLEAEKKITLLQPQGESSFLRFLTANYASMPFWLTVVASALTLVAMYLVPQSWPFSVMRFFTGGVFVLFLPGYALLHLLFSNKEIDLLEKLGISIGLSLTISIPLGLVLSFSNWDIALDSVGLYLILIVLALSITGTRKIFNSQKSLQAGILVSKRYG